MTQARQQQDALPDDVETLKQLVLQLLAAAEADRLKIAKLEATIDQLIRQFRGPKSERHTDSAQGLLFPELAKEDGDDQGDDDPDSPSPADANANEARSPKSRRGRRNSLGDKLKRYRREHMLQDDQQTCDRCSSPLAVQMVKGAEQYGYSPGHYFIIEHYHQTGFCNGCDECVKKAAKPPEMAPKSMASASMLAHVVTSKKGDHLPLYRQEEVGLRGGVWLPRATLSNWCRQAAVTSTLLYSWLARSVLQGAVIGTDETGVPVLAPGSGKTHAGRIWVYCGQREVCPYVVYEYTHTKEARHPVGFLGAFEGYLQADAANTFDRLYVSGSIIEVACAAHMRRYFFQAIQEERQRALIALACFRRLYLLERELKELNDEQRLQRRQAESLPILAELKEWIDEWAKTALPSTAFGAAVRYARNHWDALLRYCEQGWLIIDNTRSERALRSIVVGRRNWLFYGSGNGGRTGAVLSTLVGSAKANRVSPFAYLEDVFERLPVVREDAAMLPVLRAACEQVVLPTGERPKMVGLETPLDYLRILKDHPRQLTAQLMKAELPSHLTAELDALKPDQWLQSHAEHALPINRPTQLVGERPAA